MWKYLIETWSNIVWQKRKQNQVDAYNCGVNRKMASNFVLFNYYAKYYCFSTGKVYSEDQKQSLKEKNCINRYVQSSQTFEMNIF